MQPYGRRIVPQHQDSPDLLVLIDSNSPVAELVEPSPFSLFNVPYDKNKFNIVDNPYKHIYGAFYTRHNVYVLIVSSQYSKE